MPGWHAKTKDFVADDKLIVLGIAPEQHGDRMALFLQWKQMEDMPVMLDSYNLLGLRAVPITLLIDESGVIQHRNPGPDEFDAFLALPPVDPHSAPRAPRPTAVVAGIQRKPPNQGGRILSLRRHVEGNPEDARAHFQLGVAHRKRFDSPQREPDDFRRAVEHWTRALALDPANYIWRRRIQQYGPRLDKPYAFYNWIETARAEITARGEEPHPLRIEPSGAELAHPLKGDYEEAGPILPHPDPDGKLPRDLTGLFEVSSLVIPHTTKPSEAMRIVLTVTPEREVNNVEWNDEAGPSSVHVKPPEGWLAAPPVVLLTPAAGAKEPLLDPRTIDFELRHDPDAGPTPPATACRIDLFYQACHGKNRVCEFIRRDISVDLQPNSSNVTPGDRVP